MQSLPKTARVRLNPGQNKPWESVAAPLGLSSGEHVLSNIVNVCVIHEQAMSQTSNVVAESSRILFRLMPLRVQGQVRSLREHCYSTRKRSDCEELIILKVDVL